MSHPADGLRLVVLYAWLSPIPGEFPETAAARAAAAWLADHLDTLAETGQVDHGSFRLAAAEIRAAGGVE